MVSRLPAGVALAAEGLGRRKTDIHEVRYSPVISLGARLRSRRGGLPVGLTTEFVEEDEDDDDDEDEDLELGLEPDGDWTVQDVTFAVAPGEALGLVGDRASIVALMRLLVGMTAPTEGYFAYRGRAGLSSEMALLLGRREMQDPSAALRTLASLAGVGRRRRKAWIREVTSLVAGTEGPPGLGGSKAFHVNLAIAVSLDPGADVLFVDRLPRKAGEGLLERCLERIRGRLEAGAAAIIATPETQVVEELCGRAVHLEAGHVARIGPAPDVIEGLRERAQTLPDRVFRPFSADAAIVSAELVDRADRPLRALLHGGPLRVLIRFETVHPDTQVAWRVRLQGSELILLGEPEWRTVRAPGAFIVALALPLAELDDSEYEVAVEAIVRVDDRREAIRRLVPGRFGVAEATGADRGAGVFDPIKLTSEWARIDESTGEALVDPEI